MSGVTRLGYIGLAVRDVSAWERFAAAVLGLEPAGRDGDGSLFLRMDEHHHRIVVHPGAEDDLACVGWEVADEAALEAVAGRLKDAGADVRRGGEAQRRARRVAGLVSFSDPGGVATEVFFGPLVTFERPFKSPRPISGFVTGDLGLGHIVLAVDELDAGVRFYRDVLGMRLSDLARFDGPGEASSAMAFLRCNPRHHSLALAASGGGRPQRRLLHFMLQVGSLDDVGSTYDLCQDEGVAIGATLGRHTNDHMVSFYMASPSGFAVEYGFGGREVDDATWQVQTHPSVMSQ